VRIDPIIVSQDGSFSGPGTVCTTIAQQTYALPDRPDLSGGMGSASSAPQPAQPAADVRPISNDTLQSDGAAGAPVGGSGFLGAPTTLASGVLEGNEPAAPVQPQPTVAAPAPAAAPVAAAPAAAAPVTAPGSVQGSAPAAAPAPAPAPAATAGGYVVQVGAVSDKARAEQYQQRLVQQFDVPGRVTQNGAVWRIQLGPFSSKADASALQQRLQSEAQLQSFITSAQ